MFKRIRFTFVLLTSVVLSACAMYLPKPSSQLSIEEHILLPDVLSETSGLYCESDKLLSINDSGNAPVIYQVEQDGSISKQYDVALVNNDWEAITANETAFYIADVGNNNGKREWLSIYKLDRKNLTDIQNIHIKYAGNTVSGNIPYAHDFDSEAMIKLHDSLVLFSKSWRTGITKVYRINESELEQTLSPFASISGLPGVITGADFDKTRNVFVVVGYKSDPFGNFSAFIAQISQDFTIDNVWPLKGYKQVEGVCVDTKGHYWFSEEATKGRGASLSKGKIL